MSRDDLLAKSPPNDMESERCVLGATIVHPGAYDQARRILDASDFYRHEHGAIFAAAGDLLNHGSAQDQIAQALVASNVEAPLALTALIDCACAPENVAFHARRIRECSQWRGKILEAERTKDDVFRQAATKAPFGRAPDPLQISDSHDVAGMTRDAERALLVRRAPIFHRGGQLVRIRRSSGLVSIEALPAPSLNEMLSEHARWTRETADGSRSVKPPRSVVEALMARGSWSLREIHTLAEAPCLSPTGRVLSKEGWDESGVYVALDSNRKYPTVSQEPTKADAEKALGELLVAFSEFPFVDECDMSAAFALVLTLVARPAIDGSIPLFAVRGPVAGSGKGLVVHVAAACAFGRQAAVSPPERDPTEERKSLLALGAEGAPLALLDNLEHALGSDVLAAALTAPTFRARELGRSRTLEVKLPVLAATGNNLQIKGDLARRCIPIDIDPQVEQPEGRTFQRELPAWALENHPTLVTAALTVLRAFCVAGRPQPEGVKPYGSFEPWSRLVRSALMWVGAADPCGGRERLRGEADTGLSELDAALIEWERAANASADGPAWTVRRAITASETDEVLRDALAAFAHCDPRKLTANKLGYNLRAKKRRIVNGRHFEQSGSAGHLTWCVRS